MIHHKDSSTDSFYERTNSERHMIQNQQCINNNKYYRFCVYILLLFSKTKDSNESFNYFN